MSERENARERERERERKRKRETGGLEGEIGGWREKERERKRERDKESERKRQREGQRERDPLDQQRLMLRSLDITQQLLIYIQYFPAIFQH